MVWTPRCEDEDMTFWELHNFSSFWGVLFFFFTTQLWRMDELFSREADNQTKSFICLDVIAPVVDFFTWLSDFPVWQSVLCFHTSFAKCVVMKSLWWTI